MTDRVHYLTIALDQDIREDDVEPLVEAIKQLRHVRAVELGIVTHETHMARMYASNEVRQALYDAMDGIFFPERKR